ncbi:MAG: hypothetical protein D3910_11780 [Candidatus Electrothrix sp. ATG2]|nr:hypothetical protein [Candidatus Electrothrix sp. ATG2]
MTNTGETEWFISVYGFQAGNFDLEAVLSGDNSITILTSGEQVSDSVDEHMWKQYRISASSADTGLQFDLSGLSADLDLYVKQGEMPTSSSYDCRPYLDGTNSESCAMTNSGETDWYIGVYGYQAGDFNLKAVLSGGILTGSGLSFPVPLVDDTTGPLAWNFVAGSFGHTESGGYSGMNDIYAFDLNLPSNDDSGKDVHPVAPGIVVVSYPDLGFVLIRHLTPLELDDGTILTVWYSGYMHMDGIVGNDIEVTTASNLGQISGMSGGSSSHYPDHLHFAIYSGDHGNLSEMTSVDIANNLSDFITPISTWYEWCGTTAHPETAPWWNLGQTPCPYNQ